MASHLIRAHRCSIARHNAVQLGGSEDAFTRLLDREWQEFYSQSAGTRSTFIVCGAPGRATAKRLRELAGASSLVRTLHYKRGEPLCSVASLDRDAATLVLQDGAGKTFAMEPLPHLAKLAPAVSSDPSSAALLLSAEAAGGGVGNGVYVEEGEGGNIGGHGSRRLLAGKGGGKDSGVSPEQRARVLAEAAAVPVSAARPKTRRLIEQASSGRVDAIEITLALHHERRSKKDTEDLAKRWTRAANDQAGLAEVLRKKHFWGAAQPQQALRREGKKNNDPSSENADESRRQAGRLPEEGSAEDRDERAREFAAHEERKRSGWASLLDSVERGQGRRSWVVGADDKEGGTGGVGWGRRGPASCGFDQIRLTVSPSGKKVLIHRPHEIAAAAAKRSGKVTEDDELVGRDDGCLSALLAYVSLQPEVHYVTARRKTATMNLEAAWVTQSGVDGVTPLWDEVRLRFLVMLWLPIHTRCPKLSDVR